MRPAINLYVSVLGPPLEGPNRDAYFTAGTDRASSLAHGFLDQSDRPDAIRGTNHSASSSPQIARIFFLRANSAAVSASALSFRRNSRFSCLISLRARRISPPRIALYLASYRYS